MFEQTFKNIDDILHKDAGCSSELDYVEQTSWVLFFDKGALSKKVWFYQLNILETIKSLIEE